MLLTPKEFDTVRLQKSVEEEEFEMAAELRDEIKRLETEIEES